MPDASVNGTVYFYERAGDIPIQSIYLNKVTSGQLYTTNSTFGPVNDLMIQQGLIMLT